MMRRSQGTLNLNEVHNGDARPRRHTTGIRRLSRNFGIFDRAAVEQAAQNPTRLDQLAKASEKTNKASVKPSKAAPAA